MLGWRWHWPWPRQRWPERSRQGWRRLPPPPFAPQPAPDPAPTISRASARGNSARAESLKSAMAGSSSVKYRSGRRSATRLLLSQITHAASPGSPSVSAAISAANCASRAGSAWARAPIRVRSHQTRRAPARRKRAVSFRPAEFRSALSAQSPSSQAQSQACPLRLQMPWPNWVILTAVQRRSLRAAIRPQTAAVLPTLRDCPPTTTQCISRLSAPRRRAPPAAGAAQAAVATFRPRGRRLLPRGQLVRPRAAAPRRRWGARGHSTPAAVPHRARPTDARRPGTSPAAHGELPRRYTGRSDRFHTGRHSR